MSSTIIFRGNEMSFDLACQEGQKYLEEGTFKEDAFIEAELIANALLEKEPTLILAWKIKGAACAQQDKLGEAIECHRKIQELTPEDLENKVVLANYLATTNQFEQAKALYQEAIRSSPANAVNATYNLGKLLFQCGDYQEAEVLFQQSLPHYVSDVDVYINLGACKFNQYDYEQAVLWFKLGLGLDPKNRLLLENIAHAYSKAGQQKIAIEYFHKLLDVCPDEYSALAGLATCHSLLQQTREAELYIEAFLEKGIFRAEIDHVNAMMLAAGLKKSQSLTEEAIKIEKEIVALFPTYEAAFSNMLLNMIYTDTVSPQEAFEWHKEYGRRYEPSSLEKNTNSPDATRKLKVGYVSADYFNHSVAHFALPLISRHNRAEFEVHCYATSQRSGPVTEQFKRESIWHQVDTLTDDQLAAKIREDEIDILIDMSGHTGGNRLKVFAQKPAPVQISWLGYPFTTGLKNIDYRLVDEIVEPIGKTEHLNTEKLLRIPGLFCSYRPSIRSPERLVNGELDIQPTPALHNKFVTFGSCNNPVKLSDQTLRAWAEVMRQTPNSKLLIEAPDLNSGKPRNVLTQRLESHGIDMSRVIFSDRIDNQQYSLYNKIDIALDTFPCNGGTTTCDALFMGVPVVSVAGNTFMSRLGATVLHNASHPEWLANSVEEYIKIAVNMASDITALAHTRETLRDEVENSPLMDEIGFARKVERAYREIWKNWCSQQAAGKSVEWQNNQEVDEVDEEENSLTHDAMRQNILLLLNNNQWHAAQEKLETLNPAYQKDAQYWEQLARHFSSVDQLDESIYAFRRATELDGHNPQTRYALAANLSKRAQSIGLASPESNACLNEAISHLQAILEYSPNHVEAWALLGYIQMYRSRFAEAEIAVQRTLKLAPDHVPSLINHSSLLIKRNQFKLAEKALLQAAELAPAHAWVHYNLGQLYAKTAKIDQALSSTRKAFSLAPDNKDILDGLLLQLVYTDHASDEEKFDLHREYAKITKETADKKYHRNTPILERKIKVGFVSGDFVHSSLMYIAFPLFEKIDREKFSLFFYHNGNQFDAISKQLQGIADDEWRFTKGLDAETMAALIQDDKIDILLDLAGHTEHNFLSTFAKKPAPIQATWGAYPATSGLSSMDYVITDRIMLPPDSPQKKFWTEAPYYLPDCFCVYRPFMANPERHIIPAFDVQDTPALKNGYVTFGSGSNLVRLTQHTIKLWAEILHKVPGSVLNLEYTGKPDAVFDAFSAYGVNPSRVNISVRASDTQYRFYHSVDIALDCTPSNGGVTSLDTLWMGVPLVTYQGEAAASRIGTSLLSRIGHLEWVAQTDVQFVEIASKLAEDVTKLNQIRHTIRPAMKSSSLMDEDKFTHAFESMLQDMWHTWCTSSDAEPAKMRYQQQQDLQFCASLLEQENYTLAIQAYQSVLAHSPDCLEALYGLGLAILLNGDAENAIPILEKVNKVLQSNGDALAQADCLAALGNAHLMLGKDQEAVAFFTQSLHLKPSEETKQWLISLTDGKTTFH